MRGSRFQRFVLATAVAGLSAACGGSSETPPPATTPAPASQPAAPGEASTGDLNIAFTVDPNPPRSGDNSIEVKVTDRNGAPVTDATVKAEFMMPAMPSMNMPAMRADTMLAHLSDGRYAGAAQLSMAGTWTTTISVTRPGQAPVTKRLSLNAN